MSPFRFLRAGPPPPKVVLLPDALFFTRAVPITAGATAAEATSQAELAIEALSPFPLAQLYYGWFWRPGAENAFAFAAYRRRFTTDQTAEWDGAELVLPTFAAVLGAEDVKPATTIVLHAPEGLTAVHWEAAAVPSRLVFRPLDPEADEQQRAAARDELLRGFGGSRHVVELTEPVTAEPSANDREVVFRSGDFVSRLPTSVTATLDVRDKGELAALRGARRRDVMLWRAAVACVLLLALLGLGELALVAGAQWNGVRNGKIRGQKAAVERIQASDQLARRIEELATKRLLPFEMITLLFIENRKPAEITFNRVTASTSAGIYTLTVEATSTSTAQLSVYLSTLRSLPAIERVDIRDERTRGDTATFTLVVTFKPDALKPADSISQ